MVAVSSYLLIFASVALFGYNFACFIENFGMLEKKIGNYREMLLKFNDSLGGVRRENAIQNALMLLGYEAIAYFAGFAYWVLALILAKFAASCLLSDWMHRLILNRKVSIPRTFYVIHKIDSLLNGLLGVFMLLALVL